MHKEAKEKYNQLKAENPNIDKEMIETFIEEMPEEAIMLFDKMMYGCHIVDDEIAEKAMNYIKNNKGEVIGQKWKGEDVLKIAKDYIVIDDENFYPLDLIVWSNVKYGDYSHITTEPSYIIRMAISDLKDSDFPYYPSDERAYHWAKEQFKKAES